MLAGFHQSCGGGDCAADKTVLVDYDSDCVEDENDNCVLAENPAGGYNPEQFDGDEDGVGFPCDGDDSNSGSAGVFLVNGPAFNMAGTYDFSDECSGAFTATIRQDGGQVEFVSSVATFGGEAVLEPDGITMTADLSGSNGVTCSFSADALTMRADLSCSDGSGTPCLAQGLKTSTSLWSDLNGGDPL